MGFYSNLVYVSEAELRYYCKGSRRIVKQITDNVGEGVDFLDVTLDESDLEIMIMEMKACGLPLSLQLFNVIQDEYIIKKSNELSMSRSHGFKKLIRSIGKCEM